MAYNDNLIAQLSINFALRIIKLRKFLKETHKEFVMSKQILRCGTSIGANVFESEQAQSKEDFISKLYTSLKEANETKYWLILLHKAEYISDEAYESMSEDLAKIIGILVNIIKKTKSNMCTNNKE